jgi:hypothetical protein
MRRFGHAGLGRVVRVVQADAHELADVADAGAHARRAGNRGQAGRVDGAEPGKALVRKHRARDIGDLAGQVAQLALRIDQARLFAAAVAVTHEFHGGVLPVSLSLRAACPQPLPMG